MEAVIGATYSSFDQKGHLADIDRQIEIMKKRDRQMTIDFAENDFLKVLYSSTIPSLSGPKARELFQLWQKISKKVSGGYITPAWRGTLGGEQLTVRFYKDGGSSNSVDGEYKGDEFVLSQGPYFKPGDFLRPEDDFEALKHSLEAFEQWLTQNPAPWGGSGCHDIFAQTQ